MIWGTKLSNGDKARWGKQTLGTSTSNAVRGSLILIITMYFLWEHNIILNMIFPFGALQALPGLSKRVLEEHYDRLLLICGTIQGISESLGYEEVLESVGEQYIALAHPKNKDLQY